MFGSRGLVLLAGRCVTGGDTCSVCVCVFEDPCRLSHVVRTVAELEELCSCYRVSFCDVKQGSSGNFLWRKGRERDCFFFFFFFLIPAQREKKLQDVEVTLKKVFRSCACDVMKEVTSQRKLQSCRKRSVTCRSTTSWWWSSRTVTSVHSS